MSCVAYQEPDANFALCACRTTGGLSAFRRSKEIAKAPDFGPYGQIVMRTIALLSYSRDGT
jgi:hypothetical protein